MFKNQQLRILSYVVILYMLLAFSWWSILLYTKNQDAFKAKAAYSKLVLIAEGKVSNEQEFQQTDVYQELRRKYKRQEWMIFGEASVFVISLVIGMWLINRSYHQEMEAAQQRRNFLLSITHELKSPIASIKLILETFLKRDLKKEQADKLSQNAVEEADRLNTLVNDLLLAAKMETAYQPHLEPLQIEEVVRPIIERLRTKYPDAQFAVHIEPSLPTIAADKLGITSVTLNLLENAVKYSPKPAQIKLRMIQENGQLLWETADQGLGITDKEKAKVFDRFYRIGNEDRRKTKGTGLGLYIVHEIIKAHNGHIQILDNKPQGSIFRISMPFHQNKQP